MFDGRENLVGGFDPSIRPGVFVVARDERANVGIDLFNESPKLSGMMPHVAFADNKARSKSRAANMAGPRAPRQQICGAILQKHPSPLAHGMLVNAAFGRAPLC